MHSHPPLKRGRPVLRNSVARRRRRPDRGDASRQGTPRLAERPPELRDPRGRRSESGHRRSFVIHPPRIRAPAAGPSAGRGPLSAVTPPPGPPCKGRHGMASLANRGSQLVSPAQVRADPRAPCSQAALSRRHCVAEPWPSDMDVLDSTRMWSRHSRNHGPWARCRRCARRLGSLAWRPAPPSVSRRRSVGLPGRLWRLTGVHERRPVPRCWGPLLWGRRRRSPELTRSRGRSRRCGSGSRSVPHWRRPRVGLPEE